jgi:cytochrome b pre-mRNA-processing protein 3
MLAAITSLFRKPAPASARRTYIALVQEARNPFFYEQLGVPDTLDGRFEMIVLHLFLLQQRLHEGAPDFSRFLSEVFFEDMDASIREFGVADTGVSRRIKQMGQAYHGRLQHYATADDEQLKAALSRNLYGTVSEGNPEHLARMTAYIRARQQQFAQADITVITSGDYAWEAIAA